MGGTGAHEYMAPCPAGENEVALADGYAANVEVASAEAQAVELPAAARCPRAGRHAGPDDGRRRLRRSRRSPRGALEGDAHSRVEGRGMVLRLLRGDHRLNEIKLRNHLGADFRPAGEEEIAEQLGPVGFVGPVGAKPASPC